MTRVRRTILESDVSFNLDINKARNDTHMALVRSGKTWSENAKGTKSITLQDDGNGMDIFVHGFGKRGSQSFRLEYDEGVELGIVLMEHAKLDTNRAFENIYEVAGTKELPNEEKKVVKQKRSKRKTKNVRRSARKVKKARKTIS